MSTTETTIEACVAKTRQTIDDMAAQLKSMDTVASTAVHTLAGAVTMLEASVRSYALLQAERDTARSERDQHQARCNELAAEVMAAGMREWRPIKSAPKGGPPILVGCRSRGEWFSTVACWQDVTFDSPRWRDDRGSYESYTHWLPLPEGP